jgi:DNA polymerase
VTTPVLIDLETRSACDLKLEGGYKYAKHPTTRLLTVAWSDDLGKTYHVWLPGADVVPRSYLDLHLPTATVHLKGDGSVPAALAAVADRPWVGHNAWTFDRNVWAARGNPQPPRWIDTYPLALACGLPGALGKIGDRLWGEGKYEAGAQALKKASRAVGPGDCEPDDVPIGQQLLVAKYNVQDVKLLADLWPVLLAECKLPPDELKVLQVHDSCGRRGCRIDRGLVTALVKLADESKQHAIDQIAVLTGGDLKDTKDVQSRNKVFAWLDKMKVKIGTSLRKDVVARFIESNREKESDGDEDDPKDDGDPGDDVPDAAAVKNLPVVVKVLELRMQALRITGGKLEAALWAMDVDHRARDLFVYWGAHTGRDAGRRIQVQNLPRPKEGVDVWRLAAQYDFTGRLDYAAVKRAMPIGDPRYKYLSVDDAASAMIRLCFVPDPGDVLAAADLANIEARVLAWLAGEQWLMDAFWSGADPYLAMARKIFGPDEGWPQFPDPNKKGKFLPLKKHPYRQVGKVVVLGSGYQLGASKFAVYAAANGIDLDAVGVTPLDCILSYRRMHPKIAGEERVYNEHVYFRGGFWDQLDEAAVHSVETGDPVPFGNITFGMDAGNLVVTLPSGRRLVYRGAKLSAKEVFGRTRHGVTYESARFGTTKMYGGKWAENVVQAVSRDVLMHGAVLAEEAGIPHVLRVHDELVCTTWPERFPDFMRCVTTRPAWLTDFPLDAEGSYANRYAKSPSVAWKVRHGDEWVYRNGERHK